MTAVALVCSCTDKQQECMECDKQADVQTTFEGAAETLSRSGRVEFVGGYATAHSSYSLTRGSVAGDVLPAVLLLCLSRWFATCIRHPMSRSRSVSQNGWQRSFPDGRTDGQPTRIESPATADDRRMVPTPLETAGGRRTNTIATLGLLPFHSGVLLL